MPELIKAAQHKLQGNIVTTTLCPNVALPILAALVIAEISACDVPVMIETFKNFLESSIDSGQNRKTGSEPKPEKEIKPVGNVETSEDKTMKEKTENKILKPENENRHFPS